MSSSSKSNTVAAASPSTSVVASHHIPNVAGSVISADIDGESFKIRIQNMSCTATLGCALDLKKIATTCRNTEYNPRRFAAAVMRLREPRATALMFASGKMVVTGCKSTHNASLACKKFCQIVQKVGFPTANALDFKVQNIVGATNVGFPIRLEGLVYAYSTYASYQPELFPGLIYRHDSLKAVALIFASGKVVFTEAKKETDLSQALAKLLPILYEFKTTDVASLPGLPPIVNDEDDGARAADNDAAVAHVVSLNHRPT